MNDTRLSDAELTIIYRLVEQEITRIQEDRNVDVVELEKLRTKLAKAILKARRHR